jgi:hypothetical protein
LSVVAVKDDGLEEYPRMRKTKEIEVDEMICVMVMMVKG